MIYPIRTIVAGIAAVDEPDPLLASALELATRHRAVLHLVHAFELPGLVWDAYAQMGVMQNATLDDYARDLRAQLQAQVRVVSSSDRVRVEVTAGPPAAVILAAAERESADLILVGATRRGAFARTVLGTTAQRVLRESRVPILVVRAPLPRHLFRVLLATDLSEFGAGVHEAGLDLMETLFGDDQPELRSLHVLEHAGALPVPIQHELLHDLTGRTLSHFIGQRRVRARPIESMVRFGDPAKEIAAEVAAWRADLLIVGTHGRKGAARWLLGSVAESTIRNAASSVLAVPARLKEQRRLSAVLQSAPVGTIPSP